MTYHEFLPQPDLKPYIKGYFTLEINHSLAKSQKEILIPSGAPAWIFHFGKNGKAGLNDQPASALPRQYILGQTTTQHFFEHQGQLNISGILFKPATLSKLFGYSMEEMTNQVIDPELIIGSEATHIYEQLGENPDQITRVKTIEQFLTRRFIKQESSFDRIDEILNFLPQVNDLPSVRQIQKDFGIHRDTLRTKFREKIGFGPKMYIRLIRFLNILKDRIRYPELDLMDLTFRAGLHDQAHFTREFKTFAGTTPRRFFKQNENPVRPLGLFL